MVHGSRFMVPSSIAVRTWNLEPGTSNLEPRTWNPEPGTPNLERGTRNQEPVIVSPVPRATYRFGPFLVDRASYRVLRGEHVVNLTPKLLDLLLHLVDHAGTLVTKEELLDALWPGANVTDNALAQAVSELRQAIGDDAGDPKFIKTVARRGYR